MGAAKISRSLFPFAGPSARADLAAIPAWCAAERAAELLVEIREIVEARCKCNLGDGGFAFQQPVRHVREPHVLNVGHWRAAHAVAKVPVENRLAHPREPCQPADRQRPGAVRVNVRQHGFQTFEVPVGLLKTVTRRRQFPRRAVALDLMQQPQQFGDLHKSIGAEKIVEDHGDTVRRCFSKQQPAAGAAEK